MPKFKSFFIVIFLLVATFGGGRPTFAQTPADVAVAARQAALQAQLNDLEKQIAAQQAILSAKQQESASLARDIAILDAQIKGAQLKIQAHNIEIQQLSKDIDTKSQTIAELEAKLEAGRVSLAEILRKVNMIDSYSLMEVALSKRDLSEFFVDLDNFNSIENKLHELFVKIEGIKTETETERVALTDKKNQEADIKAEIVKEQNKTKAAQKQKAVLLSMTKSQEKVYKSDLTTSEKRAAQIRSALFSLRDTAPIPFDKALTYANAAYQKTGVRPAFLLGIIQHESNLGANVGSCLVTNLSTGDGVGKNTGKVFTGIMKVPRDTVPFADLASRVGFDVKTTPVSCPQPGGYGGAMGPAQFIPSTWIKFENKVEQILGISLANPWNAQHAFMASAIYLSELGAGNGGYSAESTAACKYNGAFTKSGSGCVYGREVMLKATNIQTNMIDPLQGF